jgi:hypothetical protein
VDKGYPPELMFATEDAIRAAKLHRDEFDRLVDEDGHLVCELTGHAHRNYLRPLLVPMPGHKVGVTWVCDHGLEEITTTAARQVVARGTAIVGERIARSRVEGFFGDLGEFIRGTLVRIVFGVR